MQYIPNIVIILLLLCYFTPSLLIPDFFNQKQHSHAEEFSEPKCHWSRFTAERWTTVRRRATWMLWDNSARRCKNRAAYIYNIGCCGNKTLAAARSLFADLRPKYSVHCLGIISSVLVSVCVFWHLKILAYICQSASKSWEIVCVAVVPQPPSKMHLSSTLHTQR